MRITRTAALFLIVPLVIIWLVVGYIYQDSISEYFRYLLVKSNTTVSINDLTNRDNFVISSYPGQDQFEQRIVLLRKENPNMKITISDDPLVAINKIYDMGTLVAGSSFGGSMIAFNFSELKIYISPERTDSKERQIIASRAYLNALLIAEEYRKSQRDLTYKAHYDSIPTQVNAIISDCIEKEQYPLTIQ